VEDWGELDATTSPLTEQAMPSFRVSPGNDAADAAGASVDGDELDHKAVLVAKQQKQQKDRTQPVLFTDERPRGVGIGKASCVFEASLSHTHAVVSHAHAHTNNAFLRGREKYATKCGIRNC